MNFKPNKEFKFGIFLILLEVFVYLLLLLVNLYKSIETLTIVYLLAASFINISWLIILITRKINDYSFEHELENRELLKGLEIKLVNKKLQFRIGLSIIGVEFAAFLGLIIASMCVAIPTISMIIFFTFINFINISYLAFVIFNKNKEEEAIFNLVRKVPKEEEK